MKLNIDLEDLLPLKFKVMRRERDNWRVDWDLLTDTCTSRLDAEETVRLDRKAQGEDEWRTWDSKYEYRIDWQISTDWQEGEVDE